MSDVLKSLRSLHPGMTQAHVADQSDGLLDRVLVNKIEKGRNQGTSQRVHAGIARAFGLTLEELTAYVEGRIGLKEIRDAKGHRLRERQRAEMVAEAKAPKRRTRAKAS
jgi:hypothetical protein